MLERRAFVLEHAQPRVEARRRRMGGLRDHPVAPRDLGPAQVGAGEVEGAALADRAGLCHAVLRMDAAHARGYPGRRDDHRIADPDFAREHRAGHDQSRTRHAEGAIHGETEVAMRAPLAHRAGGGFKAASQVVDALAGDGGDGYDFGSVQRGAGDQRANGLGHFRHPRGVHPIHLGERDHAAPHAQKVEDRQMLDGLRHRPVVGRHHQ